jgi:DNA-binding PadR family transcriptional regulator
MRKGKHGRHRGGDWGAWLFGRIGGSEHHEPGGFRRRFFEAGEVRLAILSLLAERPMHGYELMKEMESRSGGLYKASAGTVYPNLQMLEDEGLIRAETRDDGKRVFAITDAGRAEIAREKDGVARIWRRASAWGDWSDAMSPGAFELMGPAARLVRAAFSAVADADPAQLERVRQVIVRAAEDIENIKTPPAKAAEDFD